MYRADHAMVRHHNWLTAAKLSRKPSAYVRDNVYMTFQDDRVAFQTVHPVEHRRLMWANDHPHSDSTFPNSQRVIAEQTAHLDPDGRDDILWRNCAGPVRLGRAPPARPGRPSRRRLRPRSPTRPPSRRRAGKLEL